MRQLGPVLLKMPKRFNIALDARSVGECRVVVVDLEFWELP